MSVDRKFLDLFWSISGEDQNEADQAVEKLCNELHNKTEEARKNYFAYTRERVVKGLRSFAAPARAGFSKTLLKFLTKFPSETNNEQLLQLLNKHIYVSSFSKGPEETSVKYAYISILDILHRTDRLTELAPDELNKIVQPVLTLTSTANWGSQALNILSLASVKLPVKLVQKLLGDCVRETWTSLNSNDTALTGDQLLFLLRMQEKLPHFCQHNIPKMDITSKKMKRKYISGLLSSPENTALDLLDSAVRHSCLVNLWPALYDAATRVPNTKHIARFLLLVVRVVCSYGSELTATCLSSDVIDLFVTQLADKRHGCFSTASTLMSKMLNEVVQCWIKVNGNQVKREEEPMVVDQAECLDSPASPDTLFHCLISASQLVDFSVHHSVQKPCQFLLEQVPKAFRPAQLITYARQLMLLFTELKMPSMKQPDDKKVEQIVPAVPNMNAIRGFVANQLHTLLQATMHDTDQLFSKLTLPVVEFLITSGLDSLVTPSPSAVGRAKVISIKDATACWVALFRFLNSLLPRLTRADGKLSTTSCDLSKLLQHLLNTTCEHLTSHQTVASKELIQSEILPRLRHAIKLLTKLDPKDTLGSSMAQLYCVTCFFALSQPIEEWNQASNLLDDLRECIKRRAKSDKSSDPNELPWAAVLVDVLLGLISYPSHMLRSLVRLTFEGLIISGKADADCLKLVTDVIRTRLLKGVRATGADDEEADDNVEGEDDDLITFRNDFDSDQQAVGNTEEDMQSDEDDTDIRSQSEPSEDDDSANTDKDDEAGESDSDNDSDGAEDEEEIDETQLQSVRDSVRQALGSAVLDEEELDSSTYHEFTDEEMFARDAALVAAFRANRKIAPDRTAAERARSLGQMKMRCLDLLGCIVQHSVQPELLLPALIVLLDIGRLAAECEMRSKQKRKTNEPSTRQRASFAARYGDLPALSRISDVVKLLTGRTAAMQQDLCANLTSTELLEKAMQSTVTAAQLSHPTPVYTKYLCSIVQFLYRTAQSLGHEPELLMTLSVPLLDQLKLFVTRPRKSPIHGTVFTTLITQCLTFTKQAADVVFHSLREFVAKFSSKEKVTSAEQFAAMKSMDLLVHVFKWLATESDPMSARPLRKLPEKVLALLWSTLEPIVSVGSAEAVGNTPWFGSVAFATTLFTLLQWALKAAERAGRPQVVAPDMLLALRQLPSHLKPVRQAARRFVTFAEVLKTKNGSLNVDEAARAEKQRLKQERKKARQAKRREKALREQQRREALAEENKKKNQNANTGDKSTQHVVSSKTTTSQSTRSKKPITSNSVPLRTNPKPKSIKSTRPGLQKRRNMGENKENKAKRAKSE